MLNRIRTDLALELKDSALYSGENCGIEIINNGIVEGGIRETIIDIKSEDGEKAIGKPRGRYITLESDMLNKDDIGINIPFVSALSRNLSKMLKDKNKILIIGLGNRNVTPDSLGPLVVDNIYVTRHYINEGMLNKVREISAISPGVMAQTGIETQLFLKSVCKEVNPDIVIAVDALAAIEPSRLNRTIQICDTGISPGAGVGNNRARIDEETIGVKVIAIGVPTVISIISLINEAFEDFISCNDLELNGNYKYDFIEKNDLYNVFVTPQNIDAAIKRISYTISEAINRLI